MARFAVLLHNLRFAGGLTVGTNVIAALRRVADEHEYFLILPAGAGYEAIDLPTRSKTEFFLRKGGPAGAAGQLWYELFALERRVREWRPDVVWGLGNFGLKRPGCPQAFLCHQPYYVYDPREQKRQVWKHSAETRLGRWRMARCLPACDLVFCQTNVMLERFRKTFDYRGAMALFPAAVSRVEMNVQTPRPAVFDRLADRFVLLALTRYYAHKNLEVLIEMFERHADRLQNVSVVLTIDPAQGYGADKFLKRLESSSARKHFENVRTVGRSEVGAYYRHARALIAPTVLETTCLPYVEAMQYGTPILTGDMDFAREMCGDAALYFDPWNADSVFEAVVRFRDDPSIASALAERGRRRAETHFRSWDEIVAGAMGRLECLAQAGAR